MVIDQTEELIPNTSKNDQPAIDISSPLYIHPSDSPGVTLVLVSFDGIGYRSWKRSVLRALSVKNKLWFVNGDCRKPPPNSPQFRQWERCDDMVTSWILNSLSKEISDSVEYVSDSVELWRKLEDRYDQTNGVKLYQIQKEINDLVQGSLDITTYYTRIKRLWEELSNLSAKSQCTCVCTCRSKDNMHKVEQDRRLIQFLMGLNEVYTTMRGSILMMKHLPSLAQAFPLLVQEEKQREFKPNNQLSLESTSLHVNTAPSQHQNPFGAQNFKTHYTAKSGHFKGRPFCDYCKRPCHTKDKGKGTVANVHGVPADLMQEKEDDPILHSENQSASSVKKPQDPSSLSALFSNYSYVTPDALCSESRHLVTNVCYDSEPSSYGVETVSPVWQAAMTQEFEALYANNTWDLDPLPAGKQAIGCK
nr:PREDICTED: uncharacterized protein LOC107763743 [Nicotiana tabacum]